MIEQSKSNTNILVSIITVCFNSEKTISKTLTSVLGQTYGNLEYLVIDGRSTDKTIDIAEKYRELFEDRGIKYRVISERDKGLYDAMNKGIKMSNGDIIGMVNSDDWYERDAVETAVNMFQESSYDILMCAVNKWKGNKKSIKRPRIRKYKTSMDFCHPAMFVTKDTYKEIGYYGASVYADFDFWLRQFKRKRKFVISDKVITNFTLGGISNQKSFRKMLMRIKDRYHIYCFNGYSRMYIFECVFIEVCKLVFA